MFEARRCDRCGGRWAGQECPVDPDGLFGPERVCPRCGSATRPTPTALGWLLVAAWAVALAAGVAAVG